MSIGPIKKNSNPSPHSPPQTHIVRSHYPSKRLDGTERNLACILISKG